MVVTECIELVETLKKEGMTITTAESCTGGLIAAAITGIALSFGLKQNEPTKKEDTDK